MPPYILKQPVSPKHSCTEGAAVAITLQDLCSEGASFEFIPRCFVDFLSSPSEILG